MLDPGGGALMFVMQDQITVAKLVPPWFGTFFAGLVLLFGLAGTVMLAFGNLLLTSSSNMLIVVSLFVAFISTIIVYELSSKKIKRNRARKSPVDQLLSSGNHFDRDHFQWSDVTNVRFLSERKVRIGFQVSTRRRLFSKVTANCTFSQSSFEALRSLFISKLGDKLQDNDRKLDK